MTADPYCYRVSFQPNNTVHADVARWTTTAVALLNNPRKTREEINFLLNRCVRSPTFNRSLNPLVSHVTTSCSSLIDFGFIFCFLPRRRRCPPGPSYRSPSREELADLWSQSLMQIPSAKSSQQKHAKVGTFTRIMCPLQKLTTIVISSHSSPSKSLSESHR